MKKLFAKTISIVMCLILILSVFPSLTAFAGTTDSEEVINQNSASDVSMYTYEITLNQLTPILKTSLEKDTIKEFNFIFTYVDKNGYGSEKTYTLDFSPKANGELNNKTLFQSTFVNSSNTSKLKKTLNVTIPGILKSATVNISMKLNKKTSLSFYINKIKCGTETVFSSNTTMVNPVAEEVKAADGAVANDDNIGTDSKSFTCSMVLPYVDYSKSKYFSEINPAASTTEFKNTIEEVKSNVDAFDYFSDQYGVFLDKDAVEPAYNSKPTAVNSKLMLDEDKVSLYTYTVYTRVDNACERKNYVKGAIEKLKFIFKYKTNNGYGVENSYVLDMSFDESTGKNKNADLLEKYFVRDTDDKLYTVNIPVVLNGVLTSFYCELQTSSSERVKLTFKEIICNNLRVTKNQDTDYVSSKGGTSKADDLEIDMPAPHLSYSNSNFFKSHEGITGNELINELKTRVGVKGNKGEFRDQYNAYVANENLYLMYIADPSGIDSNLTKVGDRPSFYQYDLCFWVQNPCEYTSYKEGDIDQFKFTFTYEEQNGFGNKNTYVLDFSKDTGVKNRNDELLREYFVRNTGEGYWITMPVILPGVLDRVDIRLNMNAGERLKLRLNHITCNGILITDDDAVVYSIGGTSTDHVETIMNLPRISYSNSPFFKDPSNVDITKSELDEKIKEKAKETNNTLDIRDQYNVAIDYDVIEKVYENDASEVEPFLKTDFYSTSSYLYSVDMTVDNACTTDAYNEFEVNVLYFEFTYVELNGSGETKTKTIDMSLKDRANKNSALLKKHFVRDDDSNAYNTFMTVQLPGKLTKVFVKLNMDGGERLKFTINNITCGEKFVNTNSDYVSSAYNDSTATINCSMESSYISDINSEYFLNLKAGVEKGVEEFVADSIDAETWPGQEMEFVETTKKGDVYRAQVPENAKAIVLNNGTTYTNLIVDGVTADFGNNVQFSLKTQDEDGNFNVTAATYKSTTGEMEDGYFYFLNNKKWEKVYFITGDSNSLSKKLTIDDFSQEIKKRSEWPGREMEFVEETTNGDIYKAEIPKDTKGIVFSDGNTKSIISTRGITKGIENNAQFSLKKQDAQGKWAVDVGTYAPQSAEETSEGNITVYFLNNKDWENAFIITGDYNIGNLKIKNNDLRDQYNALIDRSLLENAYLSNPDSIKELFGELVEKEEESIDQKIERLEKDQYGTSEIGLYYYTVNMYVSNACSTYSYNKGRLNDLRIDFFYNENNGFGENRLYRISQEDTDIMWQCFVRNDDSNGYLTEFTVGIPGVINHINIHLNMDGGETLAFEINKITCNNILVSSEHAWVRSSYSDSDDRLTPCMETPYMSYYNSSFFYKEENKNIKKKDFLKKLADIVNEPQTLEFRDQYGAAIYKENLFKTCSDKLDRDYFDLETPSMYKYDLDFRITNPINIHDASDDCVEEFYIEFTYKDQNGYGEEKKIRYDMGHIQTGGNYNEEYLNFFRREDDNETNTRLSFNVPGIVTNIHTDINMSNERLTFYVSKVSVNGFLVNKNVDYVSSSHLDSHLDIQCVAPMTLVNTSLTEADNNIVRDQLNGICDTVLLSNFEREPEKYTYHNDMKGAIDQNELGLTKATAQKKKNPDKKVTQLEDGKEYIFYYKDSDMCMNVTGAPGEGQIGYLSLDPYGKEANEVFIAHYSSAFDAWRFEPKYRSDASINCRNGSDVTLGWQAWVISSVSDGDNANYWKVIPNGDYFEFQSVACSDAYLEVSYGSYGVGTEIHYWSSGSGSTLFRIEEFGKQHEDYLTSGNTYTFLWNEDNTHCLDALGAGGPWTELSLNEYTDAANQKFTASYCEKYDAWYFRTAYNTELTLHVPGGYTASSGTSLIVYNVERPDEDLACLWRLYVNDDNSVALQNLAGGLFMSFEDNRIKLTNERTYFDPKPVRLNDLMLLA